jgi:hypothetical protein
VRYELNSKGYVLERFNYSRVEAGSNTSTIAPRVVRGDEKGTQCLGVQLGHPVPGGYKYGDLARQTGGSLETETAKYSRDSDLRMTALARTNSSCKRQTRPLVREANCLTVTEVLS